MFTVSVWPDPTRGGHQCKRCQKFYTSKQGLANHVRYICGKPPRYQCPYCPKVCKLKHQLENHLYNKHRPMDMDIMPVKAELNSTAAENDSS